MFLDRELSDFRGKYVILIVYLDGVRCLRSDKRCCVSALAIVLRADFYS